MGGQEFSIGIDIGGTNTRIGIISKTGTVSWESALKTRDFESPEDFVAALASVLRSQLSSLGKSHCRGIGVGAPNGNFFSGMIEQAANLPWKGSIPLRQMLQEVFDLPVWLTNDANAAALGEMTFGAAKGMTEFLVLTLGTGVGSGFVTHGQVLYGHDGFAGELGHVIAVRDGRPCGCGRRGCLETYASATGIVTTAIEFLQQEKQPQQLPEKFLYTLWTNKAELSARSIHEAAICGDPLATQIFDFTGRIMGQTLADTVAITRPQAIICFGGLAEAGDFLLDPIKKYMEANLLPIFKNKIPILPSGLAAQHAALLGAASLVTQSPTQR